MILKCIRTVAMAALAMVSINVSGQDLLARQAPIDRKLKSCGFISPDSPDQSRTGSISRLQSLSKLEQ